MTRIIAGFAGSIPLGVPGPGTRPTSDRVREAIFSALDARDAISGARVLDLYAGSGALGLEAASRGASRVMLVDRSKAAAAVCSRNATAVLKSGPAGVTIDVSSQPAQAFLAANLDAWDIVFLDPPYDLDDAELGEALTLLVPRLAPDAVVMIERSSRSPQPALPSGLSVDRRKDYGDTTLWWLALQPA
jgi:16S rRNA (guanine966-N2)-methyltransferase